MAYIQSRTLIDTYTQYYLILNSTWNTVSEYLKAEHTVKKVKKVGWTFHKTDRWREIAGSKILGKARSHSREERPV